MAAVEDGAVLAAILAVQAEALVVCCSVGAVTQGEEGVFAAMFFVVAKKFAVLLCVVVDCNLYSALFLEMDGENGHYTSSNPPSVKNFFPTQMRCASFTARSTFG